MKKAILAACVVLLASIVLFAGCVKKHDGITIKPGVLMIGMEIGYPPMEYYAEDGKTPMGFDVDMGKAIAEKLGLEPQFVDTGWDGIFAAVDTGRFDCIMSSVTITPARIQAHNFSKPYITNTIAIVLRKDSSLTVRSPDDLRGLDVAFQGDTTSDFFMQDLEEEGLVYTPRRYDKVMYCFDEMRMGRVDAIVTDLPVAFNYVNPAGSPFEVVWTSEPELFGICLKKGNDALTQAIDKALDELFADGTMVRISNKFFEADLVTAARQ
ncbi:MAG: transporter substrate-binding domain-containing protein [Treponema sp.]|jgi:polar amino acid transport system substrate-binding protein|nr:transporter substrate-binding domain-containing protein [Treponema sp.]